MEFPNSTDVLVVGGGVAGLTAATFTARAGLDTLVVNDGESILNRNAHLENIPGFPAGVNARLFGDLLDEQASRNDVTQREGRVVSIERTDEANGAETEHDADGEDAWFVASVETDGTVETVRTRFIVAASWSDADYLDELDVTIRDAGSKRYVDVDECGRTSVEGVYAAGRLTEKYHQAVVAAGHGAEVALTLIHDSDVAYYHDWVTPEGYFTDREREVPPGCEEIDAEERSRREQESREVMREYFADPHPEPQRTHPSLVDDELGRLDE
ncbi:thioredoxin reductase [Halogeometricum borinquense DSM 11551]|uniref:Thioredoxin reductase n=1 Tax=Halogeometricum borinquense (strain ATCC 700274 / DSM 11551 / JCM 10706 / KCTC 4070 / PR3) TaxID=469382 RepID=E4NQD4_HALBP|nr:FAD-dependent oxidoreductase [Halogeometricum borinquense]ADQ67807.1 thioredoxin reductase [Halogeometricum borinquense DSM 11551]ELY23511.1 thioredoxin reductase [Halogeometricum borinquense DSM 11551]